MVGNGRSVLERHLVVVVGTPTGSNPVPTGVPHTQGKQVRDAYPHLVARVEQDWRERYGDCVTDLWRTLESMDRDFDADVPNFPSTTDWLYRSMLAGSGAR